MAFGDNFQLKESHILPIALVSDPNGLLGGGGGGGLRTDQVVTSNYRAINTGVGYTKGDSIQLFTQLDSVTLTPTGNEIWFNADTQSVIAAPVGADIVSKLDLIDKCVCMIDDVNSDGSLLVTFTRIVTLNSHTGQLVDFFDFTVDLSSTYSPIGPVTECSSIGASATLVAHREHLVGPAIWSLPSMTQSVSINTIANAGGGTITTTDGATPLIIGTESWAAQDGAFIMLTGPIDLNLLANDEVLIVYTEVT